MVNSNCAPTYARYRGPRCSSHLEPGKPGPRQIINDAAAFSHGRDGSARKRNVPCGASSFSTNGRGLIGPFLPCRPSNASRLVPRGRDYSVRTELRSGCARRSSAHLKPRYARPAARRPSRMGVMGGNGTIKSRARRRGSCSWNCSGLVVHPAHRMLRILYREEWILVPAFRQATEFRPP